MPDIKVIAVMICTYRRSSLLECLKSVAALEPPFKYRIQIIIADNDIAPNIDATAAAYIDQMQNVHLLHAPAQNISTARNACLRKAYDIGADLACFLDDDEVARPDWLVKFATQMQETPDVAAIFASSLAEYPETAPQWMQKGRFHDNHVQYNAGEIKTGHSCNVCLNLNHTALQSESLWFEPALGKTGGEDTVFFNQLYRMGGQMCVINNPVYEEVPATRLTPEWLLQRSYRAGISAGQSLFKDKPHASQLKYIFSKFAAIVTGYNQALSWRWRLRAELHRGIMDHKKAEAPKIYGD